MFAVSIHKSPFNSRRSQVHFSHPLFAGSWDRFFDDTTAPLGFTPRVTSKELEASFELRAELAGVAREALSITVEDRVLTLAVKSAESESPQWERRFEVPQSVDPEAISAKVENGLLVVSLGKYAKAQARAIVVA
jgi:HSP20 family protein